MRPNSIKNPSVSVENTREMAFLRKISRTALLSSLICPCFWGLPAFDPLEPEDQRLGSLRMLAVQAGLRDQLLEEEDAYSLALGLQRVLFFLSAKNGELRAREVRIEGPQGFLDRLAKLATHLKTALPLIGSSEEEIHLRIAAFEAALAQPHLSIEPRTATRQGLEVEQASFGTRSYQSLSQMGTLVDVTIKGIEKVEGTFKVGTRSDLKSGSSRTGSDTTVRIEEGSIRYQASRRATVEAGRLMKLRGLGLSGQETLDGVGVKTSLGENRLGIGWFEGFSAELTSPFFLGNPFTFYTREAKVSGVTEKAWFTGIHASAKSGRILWDTQIAEFHDPFGRSSSESAGLRLGLSLGRNFKLNTAYTTTEKGFRSAGDSSPFLREGGILQDALLSLSSYYGKDIREMAGYDGLHAGLDLNHSRAGNFGISLDRGDDQNLSDGQQSFWLSTLHWQKRLGMGTRLSLSLHRLTWDATTQEEDFNLIRSAVAFDF